MNSHHQVQGEYIKLVLLGRPCEQKTRGHFQRENPPRKTRKHSRTLSNTSYKKLGRFKVLQMKLKISNIQMLKKFI